MFWKFLKKFTDKPSPASTTQNGSRTTLPLAFLQKLIPIGELPVDELQALNVTVRNFNPGEIIFNRGDSADALTYLYSGEVFVEAIDGGGYSVDASTFKACYPLSTNTGHRFSAIAKSPARIVYLPLSTLQRSSTAAFVNNPLINSKDVPEALRHSAFFNGFCETYRKDELHVPSLPDVALRLRSALQKNISIADAVKIINLDPVISSKLIQVVNSPLYRAANPITSSHDAVNRLGLKTTQNLVTTISLYNLFRSSNKRLNNRIQQLWKQSIQIASLSYTLASLSHKINADEALLAGLIHNIGALPIVTYAGSLDDALYAEQELDQTIAALQGLIGVFILKKWQFPESLLNIPTQTDNWYHDDNPALQLSDIVLLARFHYQLGSEQMQKLPPLNTLPAFLKLGDSPLTPDMSLQALQDAKQQIAEALNFFRT
ncbi:MAG: HDOD domain-containing protein [Methylobacter sp.]